MADFKAVVKGLVTILSLSFIVSSVLGDIPDVTQFRRENADLTMFLDIIDANKHLSRMLEYRPGTIFIPQNHAIERYLKENPNKTLTIDTLKYHMVNMLKPANELEDGAQTTDLPGNLPIWITKKNHQIYLNNAKLNRPEKRVKMGETEQLIHSIDHVLEPTVTVPGTTPFIADPDAKKFMENTQLFANTANFKTRHFHDQVVSSGKVSSFQKAGKNTFFIPIDQGVQRAKNIDGLVIDGHVIFGEAIFIGVPFDGSNTDKSPPLQSSTSADGIPVNLIIEKSKNSDGYNVISEVMATDAQSKHRKGRVQASIVKANIPVKNGVVHLISKPLVVIDSNVYQTLQTFSGEEKADAETGPLKEFVKLLEKFNQGVSEKLTSLKNVTVFAPTNDVFLNSETFNDLYNRSQAATDSADKREATQKLLEIVQLHVVEGDITYEDMLNLSKSEGTPQSVVPLVKGKHLFFQEILSTTGGKNRIAVVDSGGTSALVIQQDIGATNGVIHMVNQILGIGENTMLDRLRTDPNIRTTFNISTQERFSDIFRQKTKMFTFFAPYSKAWDSLYYENPSKYNILIEGKHGRHARKIMERHLIPGQQWSLEEMYHMSVPVNGTVEVNTIRTIGGDIRVVRVNDTNYEKYKKLYGSAQLKNAGSTRYTGNYEYVLFWANKEIRVVTPNIKCANGYIHIIDTVLMSPGDVFVNSAKEMIVSTTTICSFLFMSAIAILFTN